MIIYDEDEVERLRAENKAFKAKMSHRKCHKCGHIGYYTASTLPECLCEQCGSADTRLIRDGVT